MSERERNCCKRESLELKMATEECNIFSIDIVERFSTDISCADCRWTLYMHYYTSEGSSQRSSKLGTNINNSISAVYTFFCMSANKTLIEAGENKEAICVV